MAQDRSGSSGSSVSKVSVSLPDDLSSAVRDFVGPGKFSAYVARAVERQLRLDKLAELVEDIERQNSRPIPEEFIREAEAAWHGE